MRNVKLERTMSAPRSSVWAVLADFPNIADWNTGVKKSFSTSDAIEGVGAKRHCDLSPAGALEETIAEWEPESRMVVSIDETAKLPIKHGLVTFTLDEAGESSTTVGLNYDFEPKGGPLSGLIGSFLERRLTTGFSGFLDDLDKAASATTTT